MNSNPNSDLHHSKATATFWAFDAFDCFSGKIYSQMTAEAISRVNIFLEACALYDKVVVSEGYFSQNKKLFDLIDPEGSIVEVVRSKDLIHAETLSPAGITYECSLFDRAAEDLKKDSREWFLEHQPLFGKLDLDDDPDGHMANTADSFYLLRLWQWGACKEMAERSGATVLLPNSLRDIEVLDKYRHTNDFIVRTLAQLKEQFGKDLSEVAFFTNEPFQDQIEATPPVFAFFVDLHTVGSSPYESLAKLRREMEEIRSMRRKFEADLRGCASYAERKDLVHGFNSDWRRVCESNFKKPNLLTSEVSGGEVAKAAIDAFDVKASAGVSLISKAIEYGQARKAYKRFKSYTHLFDRAGEAVMAEDFRKKLAEKFGVHDFIPREKNKA
ncbi:hypothetical protein [Ralstonia sp. NT80]|uniref:hypothetical protein n=1 Tax=Ralstonia sp. NT80 TaxID=1218247 RepID=UPI000AEE0CA7|nr:hypothetical protein [Ralstonia sp. NT80]